MPTTSKSASPIALHTPSGQIVWYAEGRLVYARDGSEDGIEIALCTLDEESAAKTAQFISAAPDMFAAGFKLTGAINDYLRAPSPHRLAKLAQAQTSWDLAARKAKLKG